MVKDVDYDVEFVVIGIDFFDLVFYVGESVIYDMNFFVFFEVYEWFGYSFIFFFELVCDLMNFEVRNWRWVVIVVDEICDFWCVFYYVLGFVVENYFD